MTRYEELKNRAEAQKARIARAQGAKESIEAGWKAKFGTSDVREVQAIRDKAEADMGRIKAAMDAKEAEAREILAKMEAVR